MDEERKSTTSERREILEKMVREAFPDKEVKEQPERVALKIDWGLVVLNLVPRRWVVLTPNEYLMWDNDVNFIERFEEAIGLAKQKLTLPQEGLLGRIVITKFGNEWKPEKKEER